MLQYTTPEQNVIINQAKRMDEVVSNLLYIIKEFDKKLTSAYEYNKKLEQRIKTLEECICDLQNELDEYEKENLYEENDEEKDEEVIK